MREEGRGSSGIARSQTTPGHCTCLFLFFFLVWEGRGQAPLVNFYILEVATWIVLETIFEMPLVLNRD